MSINVLVVEDDPDRATIHKLAFGNYDAQCILVETVGSAFEILRNYPGFELVLCDLNFGDRASPNVEGEKIGRWIKEQGYPSVSVLSTAQYAEKDVQYENALAYFDFEIPVSGGADNYERVVLAARQRKRERLHHSKLSIDPSLIANNSGQLVKIHSLVAASSNDFNKRYFENGYEIIAVQPISFGFTIGNPFFVWVREESEGTFLEVYGQPNLIAFGDSLEEAIEVLNDVLRTTYDDLLHEEVGPKLKGVKNFLISVYDKIIDFGKE